MDNKNYSSYLSSHFKDMNILTPEQFEKSSEFLSLRYSKILPEDKEANILDLGCGCGHLLYLFKKLGYSNYWGIDISKEQVDYCRENITNRVENIDAEAFLEGKNEIYDAVFLHDVLEHIKKDKTVEFLGLIFRSLKSGGFVIIRVPNMANPFSLHSRYKDFTHEVGFSEDSLKQALLISGFSKVDILPHEPIKIRSLNNFLRKVLVKITRGIIRFLYYVQNFNPPKNLDRNVTAVGYK